MENKKDKETHKTNLFSLQDVMKGAIRLFTLVAFLLHHVYVWSYLAKIPQMKLEEETKKKLLIFNYGPRFLTNWNFFHQTAYLLVALICHIGPKETFHKLRRYNWFHFWSVVFPWTIFIPCIFWMIFNYDRELIFPKVIDVVIPSWVNHAIHTNIVAVIVLEVLLVDERPPRWRPAFRLLTVYSLIYVSVLLLTYFQSSFWLYKFLGVLTWPQKIASFLAIYAFCTTVMWIGMSFQSQKYENSIASVGTKKVS